MLTIQTPEWEMKCVCGEPISFIRKSLFTNKNLIIYFSCGADYEILKYTDYGIRGNMCKAMAKLKSSTSIKERQELFNIPSNISLEEITQYIANHPLLRKE